MTADEMAIRIKEIAARGGVTFIELKEHIGPESEGAYDLAFPGRPNTILWVGVSETFADAFNKVKNELEPIYGGAALCYAFDGAQLNIPIATAEMVATNIGKDFATPYWLPLTLSKRRPTTAARRG